MKKSVVSKRISFKSEFAAGSILEKLAVEELGAKNILKDSGLSVHQLTDGTVLEFHGAGSFQEHRISENTNMVVSFKVKNIENAVMRLTQDGAVMMGDIERPCPTYAYCHFQLPGSVVIGLYQESSSG